MANNYIKKTLSNGVKLYLYLDKNMKQTYVDYMVDYGHSGKWFDFYLDDKLYHVEPGCAHFLEHMLGEHSKYGDIYKYFSSKSYKKNGGTGEFYTHYYFLGVNDILDSLEKLINVIDDPVFTKKDVEKTKEAIIEETKRGLNNKNLKLFCLQRRNLFKDINMFDKCLNTLGDENTTKRIDYEMLKACYDAFYYDENKTLLIAGNYNEQEITQYVENIYLKLKPHKKRVKEYNYNNLDQVKSKYEEIEFNTPNELLGISFKEEYKDFSKKEVYYYINFIKNNKLSDDSEFIIKMKEQNILISINALYYDYLISNYYSISSAFIVKNKKLFLKEFINELKKFDFNEKDFELYKRKKISENVLNYDQKYETLLSFTWNKFYNDDFDNIDYIKSLSFQRFKDFYNNLDFDNYTVGVIKSKE